VLAPVPNEAAVGKLAAALSARPLAPPVSVPTPTSTSTAQRGAPSQTAPQSRKVDIDLKRLMVRGMVTPTHPRSQIAEEYRLIKRPLLSNATATGARAIENGNLIMVTSAMPREGKSFTAINLAVSMAMELDHTVLLVDADVARPSILNRLGLRPAPGLMDVLVGEAKDLGDVLLRTNIEKLSVLPAGMPHARATEMLASDAMDNLLDQISRRYADRIVIFDSPPLLATTEARVLAAHMGQVLIVVAANETTHSTVKHALETIKSCPVRLMLLNKSRDKGVGSYYDYGYGYDGNGRNKGGKRRDAGKKN
jgi:receptor protein-tyrosine kinase